MGGYQASFQFNLTDMLQTQGDHIAACIDYARRHGYQSIDATAEAEEWWVQEVIAHRGKTTRNQDCTPGYYNFEGESNRRQDGNYNGGFPAYIEHMARVRDRMGDHFTFTAAERRRLIRYVVGAAAQSPTGMDRPLQPPGAQPGGRSSEDRGRRTPRP